MEIFEFLKLARTIVFKDGTVYLMDHPISIMSPDILSDIQKRLIKEIGIEEASKKIYDTSKKGFYKFMKDATKNRELANELDAINLINKLLTSTGWGKFSVEQYDPQKKIIIKIENSFMAKVYGKTTYACDFMLAGFLAGGLSGASKSNFNAKEKKCLASDDKYCEIEVYKID